MSQPTGFEELKPDVQSLSNISELRLLAQQSALELLNTINKLADWSTNTYLQIATSESLTAGMIMSTLVDVPIYGMYKYGCTAVYDTDAKRVFNGVTVDDVYTHNCAKQMAIGLLKNSNATVAIAVTGNAMPHTTDVDLLGEVFIGIAGYKNNQIIYTTKAVNACLDTTDPQTKQACLQWYSTIKDKGTYNPRQLTAAVSQDIRLITTLFALKECNKFVSTNHPECPEFIKQQKIRNAEVTNSCMHLNIPPNKYPHDMKETCVEECLVLDVCGRDPKTNLRIGKTYKRFQGGKHKLKRRTTRLKRRK